MLQLIEVVWVLTGRHEGRTISMDRDMTPRAIRDDATISAGLDDLDLNPISIINIDVKFSPLERAERILISPVNQRFYRSQCFKLSVVCALNFGFRKSHLENAINGYDVLHG